MKMETCPRCKSENAVYRETDRWGEYKECFVCGFIQDIGEIPESVILVVQRRRRKRVPVCQGEKIG